MRKIAEMEGMPALSTIFLWLRNHEAFSEQYARAKEEAAGHVRWLRPDYQIPRFAKGGAAPKSGELALGDTVVSIDKGLPNFPKDKGEQVMAIRAVLQASARPMDAPAVARAFKGGGKRIEQRVVQALSTLVRYGEITALPNGAYGARRAA